MDAPAYRCALIVGSGQGLSASLARLFVRQGLRVALAARRTDKLAALAAETGAALHACDAAQVARLSADIDAAGATPDLVVYNASGRSRRPVAELDPAEWRAASRSARSGRSWWRSRRPGGCCRTGAAPSR